MGIVASGAQFELADNGGILRPIPSPQPQHPGSLGRGKGGGGRTDTFTMRPPQIGSFVKDATGSGKEHFFVSRNC
ncbi:hypothetical protein HAHE_07880 [Haloferula helveola]|uniref:Uncharacterized protein n=1 Tax=Haloferula helveola TaxID=490095 RepID=A0ABN6H5T1_9BACT|nr:hypothetical protein HAHE_07880 [Haloferula helveola]